MDRFLPILALGLLFFTSCAPKAIHRVYVDKQDVGYYQKGIAIGQIVQDDVTIEAAYSHKDKHNVYYDVAIKNTSKEPFDVSSLDFVLVDKTTYENIYPADPEVVLLGLDVRESKRNATSNAIAVTAGVLAVGATVAAIATADGNGGQQEEDVDVNTNLFFSTTNVAVPNSPAIYPGFNQANILSFPANDYQFIHVRELWSEMALRRNTLFPGDYTRGLVVFPRNDKSWDVELKFKNSSNGINFYHKLIKP